MKQKLGHHIICEATNCQNKILDNEIELVNIMLQACIAGGAGVLGHLSHHFQPQGITCIVLLSESHSSIHTWPEHDYAMIDVCTCGETVNPKIIFECIRKSLKCDIKTRELERGVPKTIDCIWENFS